MTIKDDLSKHVHNHSEVRKKELIKEREKRIKRLRERAHDCATNRELQKLKDSQEPDYDWKSYFMELKQSAEMAYNPISQKRGMSVIEYFERTTYPDRFKKDGHRKKVRQTKTKTKKKKKDKPEPMEVSINE